jgi:effector-binding domain-containing protein
MPEIKQVESGKLLCLETRGSMQELPMWFARLEDYVRERRVPIKGDRLTILYESIPDFDRDHAHFAAAVELAGECTGDGEATIVVQSMTPVACETHTGPWADLGAVYQRLWTWIHEQGYLIAGPAREYYLVGPPALDSGWMTEIQIPVERPQGSEGSGS